MDVETTITVVREIVGTLGGAGTVVVLVILWKAGFLNIGSLKKETSGGDDAIGVPGLIKRMDRLTQYFNHETTDSLKEINSSLKEISTKLDTMHDKQERTNNQLEIIKEVGLPCKDKK